MKPFHAAAAVSVVLTIVVMSIVSSVFAGDDPPAAPKQAPPRSEVLVARLGPSDAPPQPQPLAAPRTVSYLQPDNFAADAKRESHFVWPATGRLTSYFGPGHPLGIDIALDPGVDSPIVASAAGIVLFAGGDPCCEYGLHVIIGHDGNRSTLYGHLSRLNVHEGQRVAQGDLLGLGGSTGEAPGKHLHFELHEGESLADPLRYLPAEQGLGEPYALAQDCGSAAIPVDPDSRLTLDFPYAPDGYKVVDAHMDNSAGDTDFTAYVQTRSGAAPRVSLVVPPAEAARGHVEDAVLEVTLSDGSNRHVIDCQLSLNTMKTLPNAITSKPLTGLNAPLKGSPTPIPSKYAVPTATPTKTPIPDRSAATASGTPKASVVPSTPVPTVRPPATPKPPTHFPITR